MKTCPSCNQEVADNVAFCSGCGQSVQSTYTPTPNAGTASTSYDHTAEFDPADVSNGKVFAMLCYLTSLMGVLIAVIAAQQSPYTMFHVRQALKFVVIDVLLFIVMCVLFWTFIIPIACGIFSIVLWVIKIIAVFQIGAGKAVEPAIIRSIGFLK